MMKRSLLAAVMPLLLGLSSAQAAEIYNKDGNKLDLTGKINVSHLFSDNDSSNGEVSSYTRLGFKGETKINDQLTGYGQWQYQYSLSNSEGSDANSGNKTRLGFAGLNVAQFGTIDYGRNYGLVYDVLGYTDMLPYFGGDSGYTDAFLSGRSTGVLTWRNKDFFGLVKGWNFAAQYEGKNERSDSATASNLAVRRSNGDGFALSTSYDFDFGLSLVGAYANLDRVTAQNTATYGRGDKAQSWAAGLKYDANQIYLATIYGETQNATPIGNSGFANKAVNFEAVAQYQFLNGLRPSLGYVSSRAKDVENNVGDTDLFKYVAVGVTYYFNKNMSAYAEYKINLLKDNNALNINTDDVTAVGLVYQF